MQEIPLHGKKFPGAVALVDDEDFDWLMQWRWHCAGDPRTKYAQRTRGSEETDPETGEIFAVWTKVKMHVAILRPSPGMEVDHRDGDGLNNQRSNLREATHAQNMRNRKRMVNNTSGYMGVQKAKDRWAATIGVGGKLLYLGRFEDPAEAARVRDAAALEHYGEFAHLNFPDEPTVETSTIKADPGYRQHRLSERARAFLGTGLRNSWGHMIQRCRNPKNKDWANYGGRGITVCERWLSFDAFVEDMADGWFEGSSIERVDNDGSYEPGNCRWAERVERNGNRRNANLVEYQGRALPVAVWARELGINKTLVYRQVRRGMSFSEAFDYLLARGSATAIPPRV